MKIGSRVLTYEQPYIVGILNLTPDSFSDGGQHHAVSDALVFAEKLIAEGADFIEIGGESTRPYAQTISVEDEISRITPFLEGYTFHETCPLILDTRKSEVARVGLSRGVAAINDVSMLSFDAHLLGVVSEFQVPLIVMHSQGTPETMQHNPTYSDVVESVIHDLGEVVLRAYEAGVSDVIVDPGIGFGKTLAHNLALLNRLEELLVLECPIMVGTSRKSFLGEITGDDVHSRLEGTIASSLFSVLHGASFVRVHDVASIRKSLQVLGAIVQG